MSNCVRESVVGSEAGEVVNTFQVLSYQLYNHSYGLMM